MSLGISRKANPFPVLAPTARAPTALATTALLALATLLLADCPAAQTKPTTIGELRRERAALQQELRVLEAEARSEAEARMVRLLRAESRRATGPRAARAKSPARRDPRSSAWGTESLQRIAQLHSRIAEKGRKTIRADAFVWGAGIQMGAGVHGTVQFGTRNKTRPPVIFNPLVTGAYRSALANLDAARRRLDHAGNPAARRRVLDEMDRVLLDVRRALWKLQQAGDRIGKEAPGKTSGGRRLRPRSPTPQARNKSRAETRQTRQTRQRLRRENAALRRRVDALEAKRSDYARALGRWSKARRGLAHATDPALARRILDQMGRAWVDVRRCLWESQGREKTPKPGAAPGRTRR